MSSVISGVIQAIETRDVSGGKKAYSIRVGGEAYGAGLYAPKAKEGDYVTFNLDESRGYKNVERGSLKVGKAPAGAAAAPAASTYVAPKGGFDARQDAISRQAASNTAISFMELLFKAEALPLGKTKRQEAMETLLHKYEQEFYERNTGVAWKDISPNKKDDVDEGEEAEEVETPDDAQWG